MAKKEIKLELGKSYIFFGSDIVESKKLAISKAEKLGISKFDIVEIAPDESKENSKGEISITSVREAISKISTTAGYGRGKMLIIKNADRFNLPAANALLKTLEEPTKKTLIILLSVDLDLLPTIVSRCQVIKVNDIISDAKRNFLPKNDSVKEMFHLTEEMSKSEDVENEINGLISYLRQELLTKNSEENLLRLKATLVAKKNLRLTTNKKLVLENLMIGLASRKS